MIEVRELQALLEALIPTISDDFRCDDHADEPCMGITISTTDGNNWNYQTGDNSFTGACYGDRHWSTGCLSRETDCEDLARELVDQLLDQLH